MYAKIHYSLPKGGAFASPLPPLNSPLGRAKTLPALPMAPASYDNFSPTTATDEKVCFIARRKVATGQHSCTDFLSSLLKHRCPDHLSYLKLPFFPVHVKVQYFASGLALLCSSCFPSHLILCWIEQQFALRLASQDMELS